MGIARFRSSTPDLFSTASNRDPSAITPNPAPFLSPAAVPAPTNLSSPGHVLPADLPNALRHLGDDELDRLLSAVIAEQRHRGKKPPMPIEQPHTRQLAAVSISLTPGQLNAVRAAFKAGVTPSRIARQFGISRSDVRKALASES